MPIHAFLSCSFAEEDSAVVRSITQLLADLGISCYRAESVPIIPHSIVGKIAEFALFIAIMTPREGGQLPSYITFEIAAAMTMKKNMILLRDDRLPLQSFCGDALQKEFNGQAVANGDTLDDLRRSIIDLCGFYSYNLTQPDAELQRRYKFAQERAISLGSRVLGFFHEILYPNEVRDRGVKNFPTKADLTANRLIVQDIENDALTRYDGIISEESLHDLKWMTRLLDEHEFVWIIDPLDGTLNFAYGFPFFCVSLGLLRKGEPAMGVLYNPANLELYCGLMGYPSEILDLRSGVKRSLFLESKKSELGDCIVMSHLSSKQEPRRKTIGILDEVVERCRAVRMLGSGQMALASIALGQFDIFFNYQTNMWDIVPGYVILKGAGAYLTTSLQQDNCWNWRSQGVIAASNQVLGSRFREFLWGLMRTDFPTI